MVCRLRAAPVLLLAGTVVVAGAVAAAVYALLCEVLLHVICVFWVLFFEHAACRV